MPSYFGQKIALSQSAMMSDQGGWSDNIMTNMQSLQLSIMKPLKMRIGESQNKITLMRYSTDEICNSALF